LTDAATILTDASLGDTFYVVLGGNRTLGSPSNPTNGQRAVWRIIQDGTGGRTLALVGFRLPDDIPTLSLSTSPNYYDYIAAIYNGVAGVWDIVSIVRRYHA
jgi:hypothetical protein